MPIYEYLCESCGKKFEKLVRRSTDGDALEAGCPGCSGTSRKQDYSTFSAHASGGASAAPAQSFGCGGGMCGNPGMCGRN